MTLFILIATLITVIAMALLIWPLRNNRHSISYARQAQNIHYARERIQELEQQLNNASISASDYEALKTEIESTLAEDIDISNQSLDTESVNAPKSNRFLISLLCISLPLAAIGFYALTGTPEAFSIAKKEKALKEQDTDSLLNAVEARLKTHPNDVKGWTLLSRSYMSLGRFEDATRAYKKLLELQGESPNLLVTIADASAQAANGVMAGEPVRYVKRALELNPQHPQALWLAGFSETQVGKTSNALEYWNQLLPLLAQSPEQQQELRELIEQTKAAALTSEAITPSIRVTVNLDPNLKASASDTVFVFAKATQGPAAPLAVKRLTVADLPATVTLTDQDAMLAQLTLSLFENVTISARVTKSGNPIAQAGDFESASIDVKNNTQETVNLTISTTIE